MKIALVHDYLREYGGAERVLEAIHEMWPKAPLFTSFVDWPSFAKAPAGKVDLFKSWDIRTARVELIGGIRRIPGIGDATDWLIKKFHSPLRFLAPIIWGSFDLSGYDVVISSSGWFMCRGVALGRNPTNPTNTPIRPMNVDNEAMKQWNNKTRGPLHICYIHHPPRNLYGYATGSSLQKYWPVRMYATVVNFFLRHYDWKTAQKVDYFVANSKETARRVEKFYRRESTVIYPPIEVKSPASPAGKQKFHLRPALRAFGGQAKVKSLGNYFLSIGRLTYSKRVDLAIGAANTLKIPLKIVGTGKEETYLRSIAGPTIEFLGSVSDEKLHELYAGAKALIFCALDEDFGIVPVEAMAQGTPVIGLGQGGVLETVVDGKTGVLFKKAEESDLIGAIHTFNKTYKTNTYDADCRKQAKKFSKERFQKELKTYILASWKKS